MIPGMLNVYRVHNKDTTQLKFTCSKLTTQIKFTCLKLTIETLEKGVKGVK